MDMEVFLQKKAFFPGVHKIGAAISSPRIADRNFTDTRIFLILLWQWQLGGAKSAVLTKKAWVKNSKTGERSPFRAKQAQKRAKKQRNCAFLG